MAASEGEATILIGAPPTAPSPGSQQGTTRSPVRIGKYEIVKPLGHGGMGAVYQAFDAVLERHVALKVMLPQMAGDAEQKQRFEREARAVARLSHPGIVTVFDLGYHTDGSPYIVMELLKGQDLLARLADGPPLSLAQRVSVVAQVLDGLGHAHAAGIVHRDIKPANVFLCEGDVARIMDFGVAFSTSTGATSQTVLGTVGYMSPEQVHGRRVDGRSDIFSVGTMLHELLAGRRPFDGETPMATMYRIAHGRPEIVLPPEPEYAAFLPILDRALRAAAEERYATAAEFAGALRACVQAPRSDAVAPPPARPPEPVPGAPAPRADPSRLFALLREAYVGAKSGHLHLSVAGERKSLGIRQGQIVHGTSDTVGEHMGDVLVRYGLITDEDRQRALAVVLRERRRMGGVLAELGVLDRGRVEEAVGLHAREVLFGAIGRPRLACSFEELDEGLIETDLGSSVSTGQLILEATRRILDPELVRTVLGDLGRVLVLSPDPMLRTQRMALTPADGFVLSRIDGSTSARDVMALVPLPAEEAERSLFSLLCTGFVDYAAPSTSPRRRVEPPAPASTPPPGKLPRAQESGPRGGGPQAAAHTSASAECPSPARTGADDIRALIEDTHSRLRQDHFEVLGVDRSATQEEIREAYASFARVLHPDASRPAGLEDLAERREAVFVRVTDAYHVLRNPDSRAGYERSHEPSKLQPKRRAAAQGPAVPPVAPSLSKVPPPHADPAPPPLAAGRPPTTAPAPPDIDPRLAPEHVLEVARALFDERKYWEAIQQLEPLVPRAAGATRAEARLLLARAYLENPRWKKRAEGVLQALLDESPRDVAACLVLASLYRDAQLPARALALYRKVLEIRPGQPEARKAVAALEPASATSPRGLTGLFKRR
jgi:serine/threonine protein kinase/tetratricopeptide (TPR) repeat protein